MIESEAYTLISQLRYLLAKHEKMLQLDEHH